jgi:hypothetical protein
LDRKNSTIFYFKNKYISSLFSMSEKYFGCIFFKNRITSIGAIDW